MTMDLGRVGFETAPRRIGWTPEECALYALSLGAGFEAPEFVRVPQRESVGEGASVRPQRVYPTFVLAGVMARESAQWRHPGLETGDYAVHQMLLAQVRLELAGPVAAQAEVLVRSRVEGIYDLRNASRSALVELSVRAEDARSGRPVFRAVNSLFVRGEGGFGGPPAPERPDARVPERGPDHSSTETTGPNQSLLYAHAGHDPHPIHVDPDAARRAGLRAPLLHGLNSLGIAGRVLLHALAAGEPARLRSLEASFAAPAYNGDALTTQIWVDDANAANGTLRAIFRVLNQEGVAVIERGRAVFSGDAR